MSAPDPVSTLDWMRRTGKRLGILEERGGAENLVFPYATNWGAFDAAYETPVARFCNGLVECFGLLGRTGVTVAATTAAQTIGVLPVGFRPVKQVVRYGVAGGTASGYITTRFDVMPTGVVTAQHLVSANFPQNTYFLDLSPIRFVQTA